jgi:hypothetical protein
MIAQPHMLKMRHRCRNPRCRGKLHEPTENPSEAFCCKGCFTSHYRNRCIICERPYRRVREDQNTCGRRRCKGELRRHRARFLGQWVRVPGEALSTPKKPIKSALKTGIKSLRGWRWDESIEGHRLLDRKGRMAACIEGGGGNGGWRIIHPGVHPVPQPVSNLETAERQAETVALCALPLDEKTAARQRAANKLTIDPADFENAAAIFQRNSLPLDLLGGYPFESAPALEQKLVKTIVRMESRLGEPLPSVPSPPLVPTESLSPMLEAEDPLAIPEFLTRPFPHR